LNYTRIGFAYPPTISSWKFDLKPISPISRWPPIPDWPVCVPPRA